MLHLSLLPAELGGPLCIDLAGQEAERDMKIFVAILSGFSLTLAVFAAGALTVIFFVNAEPVPARSLDLDTTALWTNKAVSVNTPARNLERIPARPVRQPPDTERQAQVPSREPETIGNPEPATDPTTTAAISPQPTLAMNAGHVEWCSERYRSYDPADNSYNTYSGMRRECISPYSETLGGTDLPSDGAGTVILAEGAPEFVTSANSDEMTGAYFSSEHVQSCFERYRSYRPEDNTYQPYGGGPRQQCE
jgi:hypothetical protein